jgi:hypothetical protein
MYRTRMKADVTHSTVRMVFPEAGIRLGDTAATGAPDASVRPRKTKGAG